MNKKLVLYKRLPNLNLSPELCFQIFLKSVAVSLTLTAQDFFRYHIPSVDVCTGEKSENPDLLVGGRGREHLPIGRNGQRSGVSLVLDELK